MSHSEGHLAQRPRRPVAPSVSNRTLHHPSFLPLYMAADFGHQHRNFNNQAAHPIIPAEFFYTDPTMGCGRRVPNTVTDLRVLDCFQLNTPPPVMSACLAAPNCPDPFRSGPHPTRDLGSATWRMPTCHHRAQPTHAVVQLTQEEDQAITNLLNLHHQSPLLTAETFSAEKMDFSNAVVPCRELNSRLFHQRPAHSTSIYKPLCSDVQYPNEVQLRGGWSDKELEAANTLLSCFILSEEENVWGQNDYKSAETHPDSLPYQHSSLGTETQHGCEALPALVTTHSTENDIGFRCIRENGETTWQDVASAEDALVSGGFPEVNGRTLSDSEGDAVHVLLSLGAMGPVDIVQ